jgi:hypothetical protein
MHAYTTFMQLNTMAIKGKMKPCDFQQLLNTCSGLGPSFPQVPVGFASPESLTTYIKFHLTDKGNGRLGTDGVYPFAFQMCEHSIGGVVKLDAPPSFNYSYSITRHLFDKAVSKPLRDQNSLRFLSGAFTSRAGLFKVCSDHIGVLFVHENKKLMNSLCANLCDTKIPFYFTETSVLIEGEMEAKRFIHGIHSKILCPVKREIAIMIITGYSVEQIVARAKAMGCNDIVTAESDISTRSSDHPIPVNTL